MFLWESLWDDMQAYLWRDAKQSQKPGNKSSLKSVCKQLTSYFITKEFNRLNFSAYLYEKEQRGNKPQTLDNHLKMAKHIDKWLSLKFPDRYTRCIDDYKYIKDKTKIKIVTLTLEEAKNLINATVYHRRDADFYIKRDRVLTYFLLETAARALEALSLEWDDLIDRSGEYHVLFKDTKSNEDREVPIVKEDLWEELQTLPKISKYVFSTLNGNMMDNSQLGHMLKERAVAAEITKRMYPHLLRHTWATLAKESGMHPDDVKEIMGHKDLNTTMRYFNTTLDRKRKAMMQHVLSRESMSFKRATSMIRESLENIINGTGHVLEFFEKDGEMSILLKANPIINETLRGGDVHG